MYTVCYTVPYSYTVCYPVFYTVNFNVTIPRYSVIFCYTVQKKAKCTKKCKVYFFVKARPLNFVYSFCSFVACLSLFFFIFVCLFSFCFFYVRFVGPISTEQRSKRKTDYGLHGFLSSIHVPTLRGKQTTKTKPNRYHVLGAWKIYAFNTGTKISTTLIHLKVFNQFLTSFSTYHLPTGPQDNSTCLDNLPFLKQN